MAPAQRQCAVRQRDRHMAAVRSVLATELRRTGSVRQLQRAIVTSLPYTERGELAPSAGRLSNLLRRRCTSTSTTFVCGSNE